jgi:uncharacterized Zn finger protein
LGFYYGWKPYVSASERRRKAVAEVAKRAKSGKATAPVRIEGRTIAHTFWGKSWCENLEQYSDYDNRLPRGRTYVRNGSVVHLEIAQGSIEALVSGSALYKVKLKVAPAGKRRWQSICEDCAGAIDSLVELLQGRFSKGVMERICRQDAGLFPSPEEIDFSCSCPDGAWMCKHIAAVLYGVGARFDLEPELLFQLRGVDQQELIAQTGKALPLTKADPAAGRMLSGDDLGAIFGLDMAEAADTGDAKAAKAHARPKKAAKKSAARVKKTAAARKKATRKRSANGRKE